jgi:hypothetical protein
VLVAFLIFLLAFSSYQYERSIREAFLLQLKCQLEQERTQSILNNIFPPHGMQLFSFHFDFFLFQCVDLDFFSFLFHQ